MTTPQFSLIDDDWIRCRRLDGDLVEMSLTTLFATAGSIRSISGDSPIQDYAVLRVLLPIFWRAHRRDPDLSHGGEAERYSDWWEERHEALIAGGPDSTVLEYLSKYRDRFNLVGPTPFMQVGSLETASGRYSPIRRLQPDTESDFFSLRSGPGIESLSLAEAARWIIAIQATDASGIKSGAIGDPRVKGGKGYPIGSGFTGLTGGVIIHGRSLAETLLLNTVPAMVFGASSADDLPAWERDPDGPAERPLPTPTGPNDLLTWQSRRIRLILEGDRATGVLVSNGDKIPDAGANVMGDPMTAYRFSTAKSKKGRRVFYPRQHDVERTIWRAVGPLLMRSGIEIDLPKGAEPPKPPETIRHLGALRDNGFLAPDMAINIELIGIGYGAQSSTISQVITTGLALPPGVFDNSDTAVSQTVVDAARAATESSKLLGIYAGQLLQAAGGDYEFQSAKATQLLDALEPDFRSWLPKVQRDSLDHDISHWQGAVYDRTLLRAAELLRSSGPAALIGRYVSEDYLLTAGTAFSQLDRKLRTTLNRLPTPASKKDQQ